LFPGRSKPSTTSDRMDSYGKGTVSFYRVMVLTENLSCKQIHAGLASCEVGHKDTFCPVWMFSAYSCCSFFVTSLYCPYFDSSVHSLLRKWSSKIARWKKTGREVCRIAITIARVC